jgi:hypothetical protein
MKRHPDARRIRAAELLTLFLPLACLPAATAEQDADAAAAEAILRTARVVRIEEIGEGVTRPQRLTLNDGERTVQAVWKTIDEYAPVKDFFDGRPKEIGFRDSWKHEVAAYELDKLLGLELVPPTVAREIRGVKGALQLWIEDAMTETERRQRGIETTDVAAWNRQIYTVRLFRQLTHDTDFNNTGNLLVGRGFRLWAVDHSRAFKTRKRLLAANDLVRFPASLLDRLRRLEARELQAAVGDWLTKGQRAALLARRDLIVERADRLIAERGVEAVLLP